MKKADVSFAETSAFFYAFFLRPAVRLVACTISRIRNLDGFTASTGSTNSFILPEILFFLLPALEKVSSVC